MNDQWYSYNDKCYYTLESIMNDCFEYDRFEYDHFQYDRLKYDRLEYDRFEYDRFEYFCRGFFGTIT